MKLKPLQPHIVDLRYFKCVRSNSLSLKYLWFTLSGCIDIGFRKFECVAKPQFLLLGKIDNSCHVLISYKNKNKINIKKEVETIVHITRIIDFFNIA